MQKVPKLNKVTFAGHSGGAATVHRYSILADRHPQGVHVRYVAANSPSGVYFTPDRPNKVDQNDCPRWDTWRYGIHGGPRYVSQKISNGAALSKRWFMRDVIVS